MKKSNQENFNFFGRMYGQVRFDISISLIGFKYVQRISLCIGYFIHFKLNLSLKLWLMRIKFMNLCMVPAGTQRPEDVPLWSNFGQEVRDHNRTKIGRIRILN